MNSSVLSERSKYFKENEEGVRNMSRAVEELVEELIEMEKKEQAIEFALHLLSINKLTHAEIALSSRLSLEEIQKLATTHNL